MPQYTHRTPAAAGDLALARRLDTARLRQGWTIPQLARQAQMPLSTVQRLLGGQTRQPSWWSVAQVARTLGLSLDTLAQHSSVDAPAPDAAAWHKAPRRKWQTATDGSLVAKGTVGRAHKIDSWPDDHPGVWQLAAHVAPAVGRACGVLPLPPAGVWIVPYHYGRRIEHPTVEGDACLTSWEQLPGGDWLAVCPHRLVLALGQRGTVRHLLRDAGVIDADGAPLAARRRRKKEGAPQAGR